MERRLFIPARLSRTLMSNLTLFNRKKVSRKRVMGADPDYSCLISDSRYL